MVARCDDGTMVGFGRLGNGMMAGRCGIAWDLEISVSDQASVCVAIMADQRQKELHEHVPCLVNLTWTGPRFCEIDKQLQRLQLFEQECRNDLHRLHIQQRALQMLCSELGVQEQPVAPATVRDRTRSRSPIARHWRR